MKIIRNILGLIIGALIGGQINLAIVGISSSIIAYPDGVDPNDINSIIEFMPSYEPKHFLMPFMAHALGTFSGAIIAAIIAATHKMKFAIAVGGLFLIGGIVMVSMVPSPIWFSITDLVFAYIPMAILGGLIGIKINSK